jgi:two-component system, OmpR family, sensor histidine kinase CpxA
VKFPKLFGFRSLFFKIFAWFWLTMALIIGAFTLMFRIANLESLPERATRGAVGESLTLFSETTVRVYQKEGPQALAELVRRAFKESGTEVFLFDGNGTQITTQNADSVMNVVHDVQSHPELSPPPRPYFSPGVARSTWARKVVAADGSAYIFVARFRQPGSPPRFFSYPRIVVAILIVGVVCYLLGLYLTSPLKKLQKTVKSFAAGNLQARVSPEIGSRRDEVADLGREFDHMAEQIAALIASQKRLLADISHELRSPLARLSVALELARKSSNGKAAGPLDRIEQESERVNQLVGQLLTLTRLESGAERVPLEVIALEELVQQIVDDANFEAKPMRREVKLVRLDHCRVKGSSELLRSAIENVVRNAVRYTAEGTAVEFSLTWHLETAVLTVRDHGPGIPEADLQHIFEPFYRVSEARERSSGGVGLGLSIADGTVKLHGGSIRAENTADGLLVTIELPLAPATAPVQPATEKQPV